MASVDHDGRGTFDDLPAGSLLVAPVAVAIAAVAVVPLAMAAAVLLLVRAAGVRRRVLLLASLGAGALLVASDPRQAWADFLASAPAWKLGGAVAQDGALAWLGTVLPVAGPAALLLALAADLYRDVRRPFWLERERQTSLRERVLRHRRRRRLERGAADPSGGVAVGTDERGDLATVSEHELAQHAMVLGATGSGKTTTLLQLVRGLLPKRAAVVMVDLKGDPSVVSNLRALAAAHGAPLELWTLDGPAGWNPLAHGDATELMDKLVALEHWTEPHYKRAAQRYLSAALGALVTIGERRDLERVVELLSPAIFEALVDEEEGRGLPEGEAARLRSYLDGLEGGTRSAVAGLANRIALLAESRAGAFLRHGTEGIDLRLSLSEGRVTLFSLDSQKYGETAGQLAALVAQDLKTVAAERLRSGERPPAYVVFDEFSAMGSDQVLGLLARARAAGIGVVLATQELADLHRVDEGFEDQVLGNVAVIVAHRQNVPESAERLAGVAGTRPAYEETWQTDRDRFVSIGNQVIGGWAGRNTGRGTIRQVEQFVVHPNAFKALGRGEAVVIRKFPRARAEKVRVVVPHRSPGGARPAVDRAKPASVDGSAAVEKVEEAAL